MERAGGKCCWLCLQWLQKISFNCPWGQGLKSDPRKFPEPWMWMGWSVGRTDPSFLHGEHLREAGEDRALPGWETWFWRSLTNPESDWRERKSSTTAWMKNLCELVSHTGFVLFCLSVTLSPVPKVSCLHQDRWLFQHCSPVQTKQRIFWPWEPI